MCGIGGCIKFKDHQIDSNFILQKLHKRGPDDNGVYYDKNILFVHSRLSIIDLSLGHQPMFSSDGKIVLIFNGEIYNFQSIREELLKKGFEFKTNSDTEIIIVGYQVYGINGLLEKLEGMYAFALHDFSTGKSFLARDRFGEKPLYYYKNEAGLYFASELKALDFFNKKKQLNKKALNLYLTFSYIPAPYTIYQSIFKLSAGSYIEVHSGKIKFIKHYSLKNRLKNAKKYSSYQEAKAALRYKLDESVRQRMISDVPLGAFLSGGIDSSIIVAVMSSHSKQPINTFSIGFKEKEYDESQRAALVANHLKTNHTEYILSHKDLLNAVNDVLDYFDEPFADDSSIPIFLISQKAREKVKVVLTGDCADELFAGYEKYLASYYIERYNRIPSFLKKSFEKLISLIPHFPFTNHILRKIKKVIKNSKLSPFEIHYNLMALGFNNEQRANILLSNLYEDVKSDVNKYYEEIDEFSYLEKSLYTDLNVVLEGNMLPKVDRMCMMNSLEARVPFLDSAIVEFSFQLPIEYKLDGNRKKKILKDTYKDLLPRETLRFGKKGLGVPIAQWFREELKDELLATLSESSVNKFKLLNYSEVKKIIDEHLSGRENHSSKLWTLYIFQRWCIKHLN